MPADRTADPCVVPTAIPAGSLAARHLPGAHFADAFALPLDGDPRSALELYLATVGRTPRWVERLMALRNRVVALFGLKDLGGLGAIDRHKPAAAYRVGDRIGIFTLHALSDREALLADADRHLDVKVSVCRNTLGGRPTLTVSTIVHIHNLLGRVYIFFVGPVHKRIVPAMLRRLGRSPCG